jgi:sugar-specific transcriptional regulator TrmB
VVIDSLTEMGLMSTYNEGKKTFFTAESPERLLEYLKDQERTVKDKIDILKEKMPELQSITNAKVDKPKIKYFEGIEGLRAVQSDFVDSLNEGDVLYTFLPYDHFYATNLPDKVSMSTTKRLAKKIRMQVIYNSKTRQQGY